MKFFSSVIFFVLFKYLRAQDATESIFNKLLVENYSTTNITINFEDYPGELCYRRCVNRDSRICYFRWTMEHYHTVGYACRNCLQGNRQDCFREQCLLGDGLERGVMSINRRIPGPPIHVCRNDVIVVDVLNAMGGTATTLHWHGFHQVDTPYMDGVPFVTQCPIDFGTTFRYIFQATQRGTQFYHSHSGHHKVNGQYGGIVVRDTPERNFNRDFYDLDLAEHLIVASDWMDSHGEDFMPGLPNYRNNINPTNVLINGKGVRINPITKRPNVPVPIEVFRVPLRQRRYLFRFVNSASHTCPLQLQIEDHRLRMVASDSFDFKPVYSDVLVSTSGERYDFIPELRRGLTEQKTNYWMRIRAIGTCERFNIEQFAIFSYDPLTISSINLAFPSFDPFPEFDGNLEGRSTFNHPNTTCGDFTDTHHCVSDVSAYVERPDIVNAVPDHEIYLSFNMYPQNHANVFAHNNYHHFLSLGGGTILIGGINKISLVNPPFSLLTQPDEIDESMFCDENNLPDYCKSNPDQLCNCIHRIKVKMNSIVEMIIVDEARLINTINHPFHLHGVEFYVVGMSQNQTEDMDMTVEKVKVLAKTKKLSRFIPRSAPPAKDTTSIPSRGYSIIRFRAENPGFWLLHCHFEWHLAVGMGLILQVGELNEMVKPPKNFNKCNNYVPSLSWDNIANNKIMLN